MIIIELINYHKKLSQNPLMHFFLNLCNFKNFKSRRMSTDHDKITFAIKYLRMSQVG